MKLKIKIKDIYIEIEYLLIIVLIIMIISEKIRIFLRMYFTCFLFIIFHELSHVILGTIFGKRLDSISFSVSGMNAKFKKKYLDYIKYSGNINRSKSNKELIKEMLIYMIGPVSNIVFAMFFRNIKFVYEINISLAIINLLPIKPLDGYNIIRTFIKIFMKCERTNRIMKIINKLVWIICIIICLILIIYFKYYSMAIFLFYIFMINKVVQ